MASVTYSQLRRGMVIVGDDMQAEERDLFRREAVLLGERGRGPAIDDGHLRFEPDDEPREGQHRHVLTTGSSGHGKPHTRCELTKCRARGGVIIRIPEQGGLPPDDGEDLPRGLLLLRIEPAETPDPGVSRVVPPEAPLSKRVSASLRIGKPKPTWLVTALVVIVALAGLAFLAFLAFYRHRG